MSACIFHGRGYKSLLLDLMVRSLWNLMGMGRESSFGALTIKMQYVTKQHRIFDLKTIWLIVREIH